MQIRVEVGDVLKFAADVLISTANPWLNLSGGVNGAILSVAGSGIQEELHAHLQRGGVSAVQAGTVVRSSAGNLPFTLILHAVAIDPFYDSSVALVRKTLAAALEMAVDVDTKTVSTPTLATGYGPMSISEFGSAVAPLKRDLRFKTLSLTIVVRSKEHQTELLGAIADFGTLA